HHVQVSIRPRDVTAQPVQARQLWRREVLWPQHVRDQPVRIPAANQDAANDVLSRNAHTASRSWYRPSMILAKLPALTIQSSPGRNGLPFLPSVRPVRNGDCAMYSKNRRQ